MKKTSILLCMIALLGFVDNSSATSPMPEEVKPGMTATICMIHIICIKDREKGMHEELTSTFAFEVSEAKRDVLEWVTGYVHDKLSERSVSEFKVECRFPKY